MEIVVNFGESIEVELSKEALHALCSKNPQRSCPAQHLLYEEFFIDGHAFSTLTPPNGPKLVAFHHFPKLLWKAEGCKFVGFAGALVGNRRDSFDLVPVTATLDTPLPLYRLSGSVTGCSFPLSWRARRSPQLIQSRKGCCFWGRRLPLNRFCPSGTKVSLAGHRPGQPGLVLPVSKQRPTGTG